MNKIFFCAALFLVAVLHPFSASSQNYMARDMNNLSNPSNGRDKLKLLKFVSPTDPAYGAVCDGSTDDSVALQAWLNAASATVGLLVPNATCAFATPLTRTTITFPLAMYGGGSYSSILKYTGATTTADILLLGNNTTSSLNGYFSNFRIASSTTMTAGAAMHLRLFGNTFFDGVVFDGQAGAAGTPKLWNGLYGDKTDSIYVTRVDATARNDCYVVNGKVGGAAPAPKADMTITGGGKIFNCAGAGIHVGGAFGGLVCGTMNIESNGIGVLVDTALAAEGNREIFLSSACAIDASQTGPNIKIDDALASNGTIQVAGWVATTVAATTANIDVVHWTGQLSVNSPAIFNATGDGIRLRDTTTVMGLSSATQIHDNAGYGVNCSGGAMTILAGVTVPYTNTSGSYSSNCSDWTVYSPVLSCSGGGTITTAATEGRYKSQMKTVQFTATITLTNVGTCTGPYLLATLPSTAAYNSSFAANETVVTGKTVRAGVPAADNNVKLAYYDFSSVIVNNNVIVMSGTYDSQ